MIDPRTGEKTEFGYLYQWKIDVVPHVETIYDDDGIERGVRLWIRKKDLGKLEGFVLRFVHEGYFVDQYFCDEATYVVRDGKLIPAPEYLSMRRPCGR